MRILGVVFAVWVFLEGIEGFGISVVPLIAGLGVGGLAVALAVRPTLENAIGGFILYADKPARVGDYCVFGNYRGTVEDIGLRSTRVRTLDDTIVTIPNAEFSQLQLENLSRRNKSLYRTTLQLRYETTSEQLRYVLTRLRETFLGHPKVSPDRLRIRFRNFGEYSLDVEIFAYIRTHDWSEYYAICEDLNLRVMDVINESGTGFAFPSHTTYFTRDAGVDRDRGEDVEAQVASWRAKGQLPFPDFDEADYWDLEDVLDYPPEGSPHHAPSEKRPPAPLGEEASRPVSELQMVPPKR
jgi:MscS family membrane protein